VRAYVCVLTQKKLCEVFGNLIPFGLFGVTIQFQIDSPFKSIPDIKSRVGSVHEATNLRIYSSPTVQSRVKCVKDYVVFLYLKKLTTN